MGNLIKKILIAPNSYKESIDSVSATKLLLEYLGDEKYDLYTLPLSDGGDGFLEVCKEKFQDNNSIEANNGKQFFYDVNTKIVYIESADLVGMKVVTTDKRNPLKLNSSALGKLLLHLKMQAELKEIDIKEVVVGVGGTATMDMGLGAASAFGLKLFDDLGNELPVAPSEFIKVRNITIPEIKLPFTLTTVNDVTNPLFGSEGGLKVYGPQKGASELDIDLIEKGIANILFILSTQNKDSVHNMDTLGEHLPGAGGGLSAGLKIFFKAHMKTSKQFISDDLRLKEYVGKVDYVITGEGNFDNQSFYNKATGLVMNTFTQIPIFLCCGKIDTLDLPDNVVPIELSRYFTSQEESISNTPTALRLAAEVIKKYINQVQNYE